MTTKILTDIFDLPFVWWLTRNGSDIQPAETGRLGAFPIGTVLTVNIVSIVCDHQCFTIDPQNPSQRIPKKTIGDGVYQKKVTIIDGNGQGLAPRWPSNIMGLDIDTRHFTIGIQQQHGIFYYLIEEFIQDDDSKVFQPGEVRWFSALRGFGAVASGNPVFDYRVHWKACPKQDNGLRYLDSGDQVSLKPENLVDCNSSSTFLKEITHAELV